MARLAACGFHSLNPSAYTATTANASPDWNVNVRTMNAHQTSS